MQFSERNNGAFDGPPDGWKRNRTYLSKSLMWTIPMCFFKKMGQFRPLFVYFCTFQIIIQVTNIQFELCKLKKHRWCAWDSNPGQTDGRCRRIHWAMVAPPICYPMKVHFWHYLPTKICTPKDLRKGERRSDQTDYSIYIFILGSGHEPLTTETSSTWSYNVAAEYPLNKISIFKSAPI